MPWLTTQEHRAKTVDLHQGMILGTRQNMDDIYTAMLRIYESRKKLA